MPLTERPPLPRPPHNHFMTSTVWDSFAFRDDIIISTTMKSGTTWMQQIVAQLIFDWAGAEPALLTSTPCSNVGFNPPRRMLALKTEGGFQPTIWDNTCTPTAPFSAWP